MPGMKAVKEMAEARLDGSGCAVDPPRDSKYRVLGEALPGLIIRLGEELVALGRPSRVASAAFCLGA